MALLLLVYVFLHVVFPDTTKAFEEKVSTQSRSWLDKMFPSSHAGSNNTLAQAHFTNLDGTVRLRKASSNAWVDAKYDTPLEKGDVIQTGSEGMAKVVFADNSTYTVRQDSLISIEETAATPQNNSNGVVEVKSGKVDLSTPTLPAGSTQQLVMAGSRTTVGSESALQAENNPRQNKHEVLVTKGENVKFAVGGQSTTLAPYERVKFDPESGQIAKEKELAPPTLIDPANMLPLFTSSANDTVVFTWTPVTNARSYHLRVSRNPYFSSTVIDKKLPTPELRMANLGDGAFYWMVQAIDERGHESVESEKNRFTL